MDGADIHAIDRLAGNAKDTPRFEKSICAEAAAYLRNWRNGCSRYDGQFQQRGHVEALVDLAPVCGTLAEIGVRQTLPFSR